MWTLASIPCWMFTMTCNCLGEKNTTTSTSCFVSTNTTHIWPCARVCAKGGGKAVLSKHKVTRVSLCICLCVLLTFLAISVWLTTGSRHYNINKPVRSWMHSHRRLVWRRTADETGQWTWNTPVPIRHWVTSRSWCLHTVSNFCTLQRVDLLKNVALISQ